MYRSEKSGDPGRLAELRFVERRLGKIAIGRQMDPGSPVERPCGETERDWQESGAFRLAGLTQMRQEKERLRGEKSFWKPREPPWSERNPGSRKRLHITHREDCCLLRG